MWPIRNDPAAKWLTEVNSYMQSKHIFFFFRSLTESGSTEMKEWVKDCGGKPPAWDSPWWNSPSCSSLTGRDKRWVKCLLLPDVSDGASITCLRGVISGRVSVVTGFVPQPQATVVSPLALVSFEGALTWTVQHRRREGLANWMTTCQQAHFQRHMIMLLQSYRIPDLIYC